MASYKQPCLHCGALVERDARLCPFCGSHSPFGFHCPSCLAPVSKGHRMCAKCGRPLYVSCPNCKQQTFAQEKCEACGVGLTVRCANPRCGAEQFFENAKCTACGKKLKHN